MATATVIDARTGKERSVVWPDGAPVQIPVFFPFQSYFDASGEGNTPVPAQALYPQPTNQGVVQVTQDDYQDPIVAIGVAPWSETPVSFRTRNPDSPWLTMKPGQVFKPYAEHPALGGFEYGLPIGWLGGGWASIAVFRSKDPLPQWHTDGDIMFHCFQTKIIASSLTPPTPGRRNWPTRFPWENAYRLEGGQSVAQNGKPVLFVRPTRTIIRHKMDLPTAQTLRAVLWGSDEFAHGATGLAPAVNSTDAVAVQINLPANSANFFAAQPMAVELPYEITRLTSTNNGITFEAPPGDQMIGNVIEVVRYGRL